MTFPAPSETPRQTHDHRSALFIANGGSSALSAQADRDAFAALVAERFPYASVAFTRSADDVAVHVAAAVEKRVSMVVACGGDGTISAIAAALADTDVVLGVVPHGTFNHFAKDLGIPLATEEAFDTLVAGHIERIDVGEVNGRRFVNNSGLGLYPDAVAFRESLRARGASKWTAAIAAGLRSILRYRLLAIRVIVDGTTLMRRTPVVFVGNNEYSVHTPLEPTRTSMVDGELCLYIPHPRGRLKFMWFTIRALLGRLEPEREFDIVNTASFTIESKRSHLRVSLDGEIEMMPPPLEYAVRPGALRVIVPDHAGTDSPR